MKYKWNSVYNKEQSIYMQIWVYTYVYVFSVTIFKYMYILKFANCST